MATLLRLIALTGLLLTLSGCASGPAYNSGHVSRVSDPIISTPRVSGSTSSYGTRAHSSIRTGNRSTPGHVYNSGHVSRVSDPIISTPRVSGSTSSYGTRAHSSIRIGNRSTPGRVYINARTTSDGVRIAPTFRSRYLNWSFR